MQTGLDDLIDGGSTITTLAGLLTLRRNRLIWEATGLRQRTAAGKICANLLSNIQREEITEPRISLQMAQALCRELFHLFRFPRFGKESRSPHVPQMRLVPSARAARVSRSP
jgi:hypothetical protein